MLFRKCCFVAGAVLVAALANNSFGASSGSANNDAETNWLADYVRLRVLEKNLNSISNATTRSAIFKFRAIMEPRMVGGLPVKPEDNPFQVALLFKAEPDNKRAQFCGGTLVKQNFIVTAAHCSDFVKENQVQVLTETRSLDGSGIRRDVLKIAIHPDWNQGTFDNDVAVWKLSSNVTDTQQLSSPAAADESVGQILLATGWGQLKEGGDSPIDLHGVKVPLVDRGKCNDIRSYDGKITENMICAGFEEGEQDSCQGDSGGPLTKDNTLVGITSWGYGCARPNFYGVYTRVSKDTIRKFIEKEISGEQ